MKTAEDRMIEKLIAAHNARQARIEREDEMFSASHIASVTVHESEARIDCVDTQYAATVREVRFMTRDQNERRMLTNSSAARRATCDMIAVLDAETRAFKRAESQRAIELAASDDDA